jgi:hypothetical protein
MDYDTSPAQTERVDLELKVCEEISSTISLTTFCLGLVIQMAAVTAMATFGHAATDKPPLSIH